MSNARLAVRLSSCRDQLEAVLLDLRRLPARVSRAPLASMLERALSLLEPLAAGSVADPGHLDTVAAVRAAVLGCAAALGVAAPRDDAAPILARLQSVERALAGYREAAIGALNASVPSPARPAPALRTSTGVPALHRLDRRPLAPRIASDASAELELDARSRRRAPEDDVPAAAPLFEQLRRLAHDCFVELGQLGNLRDGSGEVPWSPELASFEKRLLADLDAAVALGRPVFFDGAPTIQLDVLDELQVFADDALHGDPGRAFARAFVLGCVEGEDAARAAVVALRMSNPLTHDAQRNALSLASSPTIAPVLEVLATGGDPALAALSLDVLSARREGGIAIAAVLGAHPDPRVRRSSMRFLGTASDRETASALLLAALGDERDPSVAAAAAESLVRLGDRTGLRAAREWLGGDAIPRAARLELLRVVAAAGGPGDRATLLADLAAAPSEAVVDLIGVHGHPGCVEPLVRALGEAHGGGALGEAIAQALRRITGREVAPTVEGAREIAAWWDGARAGLGADEDSARAPRLRAGRRYTPLESLDELGGAAPADVREALAIEVAAVTGGAVRLACGDWIARQLSEIATARAKIAAERSGYRPGDWPESRLR